MNFEKVNIFSSEEKYYLKIILYKRRIVQNCSLLLCYLLGEPWLQSIDLNEESSTVISDPQIITMLRCLPFLVMQHQV
jgi:hypothetical protein